LLQVDLISRHDLSLSKIIGSRFAYEGQNCQQLESVSLNQTNDSLFASNAPLSMEPFVLPQSTIAQ
jgi:hypothetical protein